MFHFIVPFKRGRAPFKFLATKAFADAKKITIFIVPFIRKLIPVKFLATEAMAVAKKFTIVLLVHEVKLLYVLYGNSEKIPRTFVFASAKKFTIFIACA